MKRRIFCLKLLVLVVLVALLSKGSWSIIRDWGRCLIISVGLCIENQQISYQENSMQSCNEFARQKMREELEITKKSRDERYYKAQDSFVRDFCNKPTYKKLLILFGRTILVLLCLFSLWVFFLNVYGMYIQSKKRRKRRRRRKFP